MIARKPLMRVVLGALVILFSLTMFGAYLYRTKERADAKIINEARMLDGATKSYPVVRPSDLSPDQTQTTLSHGASEKPLEFQGPVTSKSTTVFPPGDLKLPSEATPQASPRSTPVLFRLPSGETVHISSKSGRVFPPGKLKLQPEPTPVINYGPEINPPITSKSLAPIFSPRDVSPAPATSPVPTQAP